jgi:hypothetical protein
MEDTSVPALAATAGRLPRIEPTDHPEQGQGGPVDPDVHIVRPSSNRLADSSPIRLDVEISARFHTSYRANRRQGRPTPCRPLSEFHPA